MNEPKEIIKELQRSIKEHEIAPLLLNEDIEYIIEALEKQIPKKPSYDEFYFRCSNCGHAISHFFEFGKFCSKCGQALDWSEE